MPHFVDGELRGMEYSEEMIGPEDLQPQVGAYNGNIPYGNGNIPMGGGYLGAQMSIPPPVQQGWQCPVCFRIMSPSMPTCAFDHGRSFENANLRVEMPRLWDETGPVPESGCSSTSVPGMRDPNETDHSARRVQDQRDDRI